jgi:hypothetical protein
MVTTKTAPRPAAKKASATPAKKSAAPVQAAQAVKPVKTTTPAPGKTAGKVSDKASKKKDKPEKVKVVRDSFTIPKTEYAQIAAMKKRAMDLGLEAKKSELIRAGLALLGGTADAAFRKALGNVPTLKTGRPGKV